MRIAITGATGFIGRHLTAALVERGDTVTAIPRPYDPSSLPSTLGKTEVVVHLAGLVTAVRASEYTAANVACTRTIAEAVGVCGVTLVHASSLAAAGPAALSAPLTEDDPTRPVTPYGRSKLQGEQAVQAVSGLKWTILRPGVVYGPGDRALLPLFRYARLGMLPWAGNISASYTFIYIDDLVAAILAAIDRRPAGETIFLGHGTPVASIDVLNAVKAATGGTASILRVPDLIARVAASAGDLAGWVTGRPAVLNRWRYGEMAAEGFVCRVDKMRDLLGVMARVGIEEGVTRTASWYREAGWIT